MTGVWDDGFSSETQPSFDDLCNFASCNFVTVPHNEAVTTQRHDGH